MVYKNCSCTAKTFYGVTFEPGQIKEVDGIISDKMMICIHNPSSVTKTQQQKPSPEPAKDTSPVAPVEVTTKVEPVSQPASTEKTEEVSKTEEKTAKGKKS